VIASLLAACGDDDDDATEPGATATTGGAQATATTGGAAPTNTTAAAQPTATSGGTEPTATTGGTEPTATTGGGAQPTVAPGPGRGGGDLLRILFWQAPTNLNPHFSQGDKDAVPSRTVLEPLSNYDNDGNLQPVLITEVPSLENGMLASDGTSVTYKLKEGVVWSDGEPLTAEDVRFTWEFVVNEATAATTFATYDVIEDIEVVDDLTVTLHFKDANPQWFGPFTGGYVGQVLPSHILKDFVGEKARDAEFNLKPIGTGPYKVDEFRPGDVINLSINETFRDETRPYFKQVEWKGGGDATSAARAVLQSGETDYGWNLQVEKQVLDQLAGESGAGELLIVPGTSVEQILVNFADPNAEVDGARSEPSTQHPFLSDLKVRQAFATSCDRETIATELYGPAGQATANELVAPTKFVSPNTSFTFDVEAAGTLLDEAGWTLDGDKRSKDGVEMKVLYQTTVNPVRQKTQEIVKAGWEQLGVATELKSIDAGVFFSSDAGNPDTASHFYADFEMYTNGPTSPYPIDFMAGWKSNEPEVDLAQKANQWSGNNYNRWVNEEFNTLWEAARTELDPEKQAPLFIGMNDLIINEVVRIPLVHRATVNGISKKVRGNQASAWDVNVYDIENWFFEE
jgi:peptide/nickel transport system substrate-binding protein